MTSDPGAHPPGDDASNAGQVAVGHHARGIAVVTMSGEHDLSTQPLVAHALALAAERSSVVVDLSRCSFVDSTIIRELVHGAAVVRSGGEQLVLVIPPEQAQVARVAEMVGLAQHLEIHGSSDAAFARLAQTAP